MKHLNGRDAIFLRLKMKCHTKEDVLTLKAD